MTILAIRTLAVRMRIVAMAFALAFPNIKAIRTAVVGPNVSSTPIVHEIGLVLGTSALTLAPEHVVRMLSAKYSITFPCAAVQRV